MERQSAGKPTYRASQSRLGIILFDWLVVQTERDDDIHVDLLRTVIAPIGIVVFGALSVGLTVLTYSILYDPLAGFIMLVATAMILAFRIHSLRTARNVERCDLDSAGHVIFSGIAWAMIIGIVMTACALTDKPMLVTLGGLVATGVALGCAFSNAGIPRFAKLQVALLVIPYMLAVARSHDTTMVWITLQSPLWVAGIFIVIQRSHETSAKLIRVQHANSALAFTDSLTSLPNRAKIIEILRQQSLDESSESGFSYLFFIDLDDFKTVNDTHGHFVGDELLKQIAGRMSASLGTKDVSGRMGGDEFVILVWNADLSKMSDFANKLVEVMSAPYDVQKSAHIHITISIGGTPLNKRAPVSALRSADAMLYESKRAGKNSFRLTGT